MELSFLLARIIGVSLVLVAGALLVNRKNIDLLFSLYKHTAAVFITGVFETILGITIVLNHNVWALDFRSVVTAIGWILLLRGLGRIFFPSRIPKMLEKFKKMRPLFTPLLIAVLLIGTYLAISGFMLQ